MFMVAFIDSNEGDEFPNLATVARACYLLRDYAEKHLAPDLTRAIGFEVKEVLDDIVEQAALEGE